MKEKPTLTVNIEHLKQVLIDGDFDNTESVKELVISESITEIDKELLEFMDMCDCLETITVHPGNLVFASENGILFSKYKSKLLYFPRGLEGDYIVPDFVSEIGRGAFNGCVGLLSVVISDTVEVIGEGAFYECMCLQSVFIPKSVVKIGEFAFGGGFSMTIEVDPENPVFTSENGELKRK